MKTIPKTALKKAALLLIPMALYGSFAFGSQDAQLVWGRQLGTTSDDFANVVAADADGNSWIAGNTSGNLGGQAFGGSDIVVAKYDPSGIRLWVTQLGTAQNEGASAITLDPQGNAYITGITVGKLGDAQFGGTDAFICKLNTNGTVLWIRQFGTTGTDAGNVIKLDTSGNIYVAGDTTGKLGTNQLGARDCYLSKFDSGGQMLWTRQWGTSSDDVANGIAFDQGGNFLVTGQTSGRLGSASFGGQDMFLTKIDPAGNVLWSQQYGTSSSDVALSALVDDETNVFVGGYTYGSMGRSQLGQGDSVLLKLSSTGTLIWQRQFGTTGWDGIKETLLSPENPKGVIVSGCGNYAQCLAFVRKFDPEGNELWKKEIFPPQSTCGGKIAMDGKGNIFQSGGTVASLFDAYKGSGNDIFLVKYSMKEAGSTFSKMTNGPAGIGNSGAGAWGDFNQDGWPDLYVTPLATGPSFLFVNNGDGTFTQQTNTPMTQVSSASYSCAWGDFDNDGGLDLLKLTDPGNPELYRNVGNGVFTNVTAVAFTNEAPRGIDAVWGDYDNDGNLDIFLACYSTNPQGLLLHNQGNGTFLPATGLTLNTGDYIGAGWGDYDNDGYLDLVVARYRLSGTNGSNLLFHNERNGTFRFMTNSPVALGPDGNSVCWGDYDNDGYLDLFVGRNGSVPLLYHNNTNGTFTRITTGPIATTSTKAIGAAWADYDNDGYLDLFISAYQSATSYLYHNNGDGTFTRITTNSIVNDYSSGYSVAWADYDNNGFSDLFVANEGTNNFLYRNDGNSNNWITLKCEGRISNRAAIGAKVRVKATIWGKETWQLREISGGTDVGSQNDLRAQFGLGDATHANTIRIEWPSGIVQEFQNVAAKQILTVREPSKLSGSLTNGNMGLELRGGKGIVYRIESSEDLGTWSPWTVLTNSSSSTNWIVPGTARAQYFRAAED
jgi:hypothetical protein